MMSVKRISIAMTIAISKRKMSYNESREAEFVSDIDIVIEIDIDILFQSISLLEPITSAVAQVPGTGYLTPVYTFFGTTYGYR
jgi:hypothetical protein